MGSPGGGRPARRLLAVEDPKRVGLQAGGVLVAQLVPPGRQVLHQEGQVPRTAPPVTHRVDAQRVVRQPKRPEEGVGQGHHLHVEVGVRRPERLHPDLVVLAVPAGGGPLVTERGRHVPRFPGQGRVVLDEGPHHGGGALGPQGQLAPSPVGELVHLFVHDVALVADPAPEHRRVLEHRRVDQAVAGPLDLAGEAGHERLPAGGLGPQHVVGAPRGTGRAALGPLGRAPNRLVDHAGPRPSCREAGGRRRRRRRGV